MAERRHLRSPGVLIAAALVAATLQVVGASAAVAAPVTCSGTAKVFDPRWDGSLWYYEHRAPATGDYNWAEGRRIGAGFTGPTVASADGTVYHVNAAGELRRYRYDGTRWTDGAGTVVGTGWQQWVTDGRLQLTADSRGRLFAVDQYGSLLMFDQSVPAWDPAKGIALDTGWFGDVLVGAGDDVLYRISETTGGITRYRYDRDAQRLTRSPEYGTGWYGMTNVFSPGGDVLYGIANGTLYWYRYDADTATWANGGNGRVVGAGWGSVNSASAAPDTCSVPAPTPVGPATPAPPDPDRPFELSGAAQNFGYILRDAQGRAVELREISDTRLNSTPVGDRTFGSDLSAVTSRDDHMTEALAGLDASGSAWLTEGTGLFSPGWRPFGKGLTRLELTEALAPSDPLQAVAVDGVGGLWWRQRVSHNGQWLAWQRVGSGNVDSVASGSDLAYGVRGDQWFMIARTDGPPAFRTGQLPAAADVDGVIAAEATRTSPVLLARHVATGQPHYLRGNAQGFQADWQALPPLTEDGSVTLADQPMSATQLSSLQLGIAAVGSDGHAYVTRGTVGTGQFQPWQRVGEPVAGGVRLVTPYFQDLHLGYRGQDGKFYHYGALVPNNTNPLDFTGGGRALG